MNQHCVWRLCSFITTRTTSDTPVPRLYVTDFLLRIQQGLQKNRQLQYEKYINEIWKEDNDNWEKN